MVHCVHNYNNALKKERLSMSTSNDRKEHDSTQPKADSQVEPKNPMKSVQTKPLPTKPVYFSERDKKKENDNSSN